jgi:hypothetical protein
MYNKFMIIILSLSLLAEDKKSESAVRNGDSKLKLQSGSDVKEKKPILHSILYPEDITSIDDITGYQFHKDSKLVNFDAKKISSQALSPAQLFDKAKAAKPLEISRLVSKPDVNKSLSLIKKLSEEKVDQAAQSQTSLDINLLVDKVDNTDEAFEPSFTRHKMELDLEIPEHQDFYDELIYLISLGLKLPKDSMFSSKMEGKKSLKEVIKLFTLVLGDQSTEDEFKNELKYFRKIAKIRASHPDAILPKKYLEIAQKLEGEELQNALKNYYREYESQVKSILVGNVFKAKKLPYHNWSRAIQDAIAKSKDSLVDYQQLVGDLIEVDYKPTAEITAKLAQIINLLQSESRVIKTNLSNLKDYLEKNNFNDELIIVIKELFIDLENFRKILLTKSRFKALSQDSDLDLTFAAAYENIKKLFDAKASKFYDPK